MPSVEEHLTDEQTKEISMKLLQTIKIPRGNVHLAKRNLPKSQYEEDPIEQPVRESEKETDDEMVRQPIPPQHNDEILGSYAPNLPPKPL